jgi:hypothetical protein
MAAASAMHQGMNETQRHRSKDIRVLVVNIGGQQPSNGMRTNIIIISLLWMMGDMAHAAEQFPAVRIAEPYIELRTGPGSGYPVFLVIERGERIELLKSKTNWFKVRTTDNREGWVDRSQLEQTLTPEGEKTRFKDVARMDFLNRRWGIGVSGGDYGGAPVITLHGGYAFTDNLSGELSLAHVVGEFSSSLSAKVGLLSHPFPEWRIAPFFALGAGVIRTAPRTTLVKAGKTSDALAAVGIGIESYLTRRFVLRAEYNNYVVFSANNDQDHNEEVDEWEAGFAIFF